MGRIGMGRELKFRGKRTDNGEWAFGYLVVDESGENHIVDNFGTSYSWDAVDPKTVGQLTGLKDKNGKEIYEGDIFQPRYNRFKPMLVEFNDGKYNICDYQLKRCEVIGNIYENSRLLGVR